MEGTNEGKNFVTRGVCIAEFKSEKFQNVRDVNDKLSLAKQSVKGWMSYKNR